MSGPGRQGGGRIRPGAVIEAADAVTQVAHHIGESREFLMKSIEGEIARFLAMRFRRRGWRQVELDVHDVGGAQSFDGRVTIGWLKKTEPLRSGKTGAIAGLDETEERDLSDLLFRLREVSESEPEGPWYHACISVDRNAAPTTKYWWEGTDVSDPSDLIANYLGLPVHPFKRKISHALLRKWPQDQLCNCVEAHVVHNKGKGVSLAATRLYAAIDWLADANNGGHNQYFYRPNDWLGAGLPKRQLVVATHEMLSALDRRAWLDLFEEAVGLWSHVVPVIEEARVEARIAARPRKEESDLDSRYFQVSSEIYSALNDYVRLNVEEFSTSP